MSREQRPKVWDGVDKQIYKIGAINYESKRVSVKTPGRSVEERRFDEVVFLWPTGLLDKNGVEIYEGDILTRKYNNSERHVVVKYVGCAFEVHPDRKLDVPQRLDFWLSDSGDHFVVGNMYESPELIEALS